MTSTPSILTGFSSLFRAGSSDLFYNGHQPSAVGHQLSPPCRYPTVLFVE